MRTREILSSNVVQALLIVLVFVIFANIALYLLRKYVEHWARKTETLFDDKLVKRLEIPVALISIFIGLRLASKQVHLNSFILNSVETFLLLMVTYCMILGAGALIDIWTEQWKLKTKSEFEDEIIPFVRSFINIIIFVIGLMMILNSWSVQVGPLLASLGILGLALGLALQSTLSNVFGGISLVLDKAFKSGDMVRLEDATEGKIKTIGIRSTKLITIDNEMIIIPNKKLSEAQVMNYAKPNNILRIRIPVSVAYGSDIDYVEKVLLGCTKKFKDQMTKEPFVRMKKMNDFSLDFELNVYINDYHKRLELNSDLHKHVYKTFQKRRIEIPFPTRTVYVTKTKRKH